jgi:hypothetical protein
MAKKKIAEEKETATEIVPLNPLELRVTKNVVGVLETNIEQLEAYVTAKLEEYKPETYFGDADMARKDRAELNNSKKVLSQARIQLMRELMKPYSDFETRCKNLEKMIDTASGKLDDIVKTKEEEEKTAKKIRITEIWNSRNFTIVSLEKIFNPRWLNKSYKESDISAEIDEAIEKILANLKQIERFSDDAETLKAHYLLSLDIEETFQYGDELQQARERAEKEKTERAEREHNKAIEAQKADLQKDYISNTSLACEALDMDDEPLTRDYVIKVSASDSQIHDIKNVLTQMGIVYNVEVLIF